MEYSELLQILKNLKFDVPFSICVDGSVEIYIIRPSKLPKQLKNKYDLEKNFQIWIRTGNREFRPNHLRVLVDLHLRARSRPELKQDLLAVFESIFCGRDPTLAAERLTKESFPHQLNTLTVIAQLGQLFLAEQETNYTKESKYEPRTLFLQGWVRQVICEQAEIDNLIMSICRSQPPKVQYTCLNNKNHKRYDENAESLWYFKHATD